MNKVFISGIIVDTPILHNEKGDVAHLTLKLGVRYKQKTGEFRKEAYRVSAWNNTAKWAAENLKKGQIIAVQGYLAQRQMKLGNVSVVVTEISVDEFLPMRIVRDEEAKKESSAAMEEAEIQQRENETD